MDQGIAGGRLGGLARAAADSFPHARKLRGQDGELSLELSVRLTECLNRLLLDQDERPDCGWVRQSVGI